VRSLLAIGAVLCLASAASVFAQVSSTGTGTITGTVYDNVGVLPGASVTATNVQTKAVRTTTTSEIGLFRFPGLTPGRYTVKVEVQGFKPLTVEEFPLLAETRDFGKLVLEAGGVQESVSVIAQVTPVQVATSSRQQGITSDQIENITMKGRDIYGFLATVPGVLDSNLNRDFTKWDSAGGITINGAPSTQNNVMIDGIPQRDETGPQTFVNLNIDAVGEVQVIASGFTAENGRSNAGLVNFVTKAGTTSFKGAGWYNAKRDKWNKNDYVRIRNHTAKPLYRVNIGGFALGGPVIIPKLLDSRTSQRKVFFFVSQEYTDDARPSVSATANYPTALERVGNFSETHLTSAGANYGKIQPILDYQNGLQPFPNNIIPADRINPVGSKLLNLMQMPNGYVPPGANTQYNANFIQDLTPLHNRVDYVFRGDAVLTQNLRFSGKLLADHEDNIVTSAFGPGFGRANNYVPGWLVGGSVTYVVNPTMVNEINGAFTINHFAYRGYPDGFNYSQYYCENVGVCAPRITPWEQVDHYHPEAPPVHCCALKQADQYPYVAIFSTGGGNRAGLANYSPGASGGRVMPTSNHNSRYVFQDDLSKTVGRHALKFGVSLELASKTEPGTTNYMGNFNFGSSGNNPNDSGNGYANMLLGVITTYTESTVRVDKDVRHWQNDAYVQDSWRISSRLTMDYGVRFTHSGAFYETNHSTAAFYPELFDASTAPSLYTPYCTTGAAGNERCSPSNQKTYDPRYAAGAALPGGGVNTFPFQLANTVIPGSGDFLDGILRGGRGANPGGVYDPSKDRGNYFDYPALLAAPRFGIAWDVNGDGRSAVRASAGVFYSIPAEQGGSQATFVGTPPVSFNQVANNITMDQLAAFSTGGSSLTFTNNPIASSIATVEGQHYRLPVGYNVNAAYQRDIGFSTVVEAAYVGNWTKHSPRTYNLEVFPLYFYADPAHQFNNTQLSANYFKPSSISGYSFPGMGNMTDSGNDVYSLEYNALQFSVQRRLSKGLQLGLAYTFSKAMGEQGWDPYTADPSLTIANVGGTIAGGETALHNRYWGPTNTDRRHNMTFNYSYQIPNTFRSTPVLKWVLADWQVSGVTKWLSGTSADPNCSSNNAGVVNSNPSLSIYGNGNIGARCTLTGAPVNALQRVDVDPANPDPLTATYFNIGAFAMTTPISSTVGNFGNTPLGLLRNPSYSTWDLTLARRIPIKLGRNGAVRLQLQAYNIFNQLRFTSISTGMTFTGADNATLNSTTVGRVNQNSVINPRQLGITIRLDF
jgi:hypothetical protein